MRQNHQIFLPPLPGRKETHGKMANNVRRIMMSGRKMMRNRFLGLALGGLIALGVCAPATARADFQEYLKKPEPVYKWEKRGETKVDGATIYELHLVSQEWQGHVWEHKVQIFRPDNLKYPHFCTLLNTGGSGSQSETQLGVMAAKNAGALFAIVFGIPKQPLYGGKTEDALVVYTWQKFLETGDESWPLHFPMAKSVIKAMDAVQELTKSEKQPAVSDFLVTGASKRGWTAWMVGASKDKRVKAIAPMVIDTLNLAKQVPHHLAMLDGVPSEEIEDYVKGGMLQALNTEKGKRLIALEDPYSYRDILTLPKLIINGTNDRYWAQDALNLYWDDLKGDKWVLYAPNSGHGLEDRMRVFNTLSAFAIANASKKPLPKLSWTYTDTPNGAALTLNSNITPKSARLFSATAPKTDFRDSKWTSEPITLQDGRWTTTYTRPADANAAIFGEATYEIDGKTFTLSTQIKILRKPSAAK
jgi:PhoPQ-activated pathogenicity-related protein